MRSNIIVAIFFFVIFSSCKSYYLVSDKYVGEMKDEKKVNFKNVKPINSINYDLYVKDVCRKKPIPDNFYDSGRAIHNSSVEQCECSLNTNEEERLDIQYLLIEKTSLENQSRRVIYLSTIPPYLLKETNNLSPKSRMIYDYPIFDQTNVINVNFLNYFRFGYIERDEKESKEFIAFYNNCCDKSKWFFSDSSEGLIIDKVVGVPKSIRYAKRGDYKKLPKFKKINGFSFKLNKENLYEYSSYCTSDLDDVGLQYDEYNHCIYFRFKSPIDYNNRYNWLYFKEGRVKNKWVD